MAEISLRDFQYPADYPSTRLLWEQAGQGIQLGRSDDPLEIQKKVARDPDLFIVAEAEGKIVGTVIGGFDGRRGMVYHLAVSESYRKQGLGGSLMDELERRLKAKGCIRSYLLVTVENEKAIHFYEENGWVRMNNVYTFGKDLE